MLPATLQFLIVMVASSINERMQKRLDYKTEEVLVLKEMLRTVTGKARSDHCPGKHCVQVGRTCFSPGERHDRIRDTLSERANAELRY